MENILIFKTASDAVVERLLEELKTKNGKKYCLIQSSLLHKFQDNYFDYRFVDIRQEGFYDLPDFVIKEIEPITFKTVYVPITGVRAINFGNILEIIRKLHYENIVFYNCNGERRIIRKMNRLQEYLIRIYINIIERLYVRG